MDGDRQGAGGIAARRTSARDPTARIALDSKRVLRSTLATMAAASAIGATTMESRAPAHADAARTDAARTDAARAEVARTDVARAGVARTDAARAAAPAGAHTEGDQMVVHENVWRAPVVKVRTWRTTTRPRVVKRLRAADPRSHNKEIALDHVVRRSWSYRQFQCLDSLWTRESNWNHRAYNSSSGAYGIPQALPGGKMQGAGSDWRSNPETQIRWGLTYIRGRYGRPCDAWGHFQAHNWY
ncbi:lytic transglycosylase domain-containing protein [Nonomuraea sp. NPDC047897]|uniref:aggregation-promoting factor C-terminal-like domain-containing protein n=1 Tax=Nonomuraea sp. NPDC047897 TaxID=3364346 RepID=UPI0037185641